RETRITSARHLVKASAICLGTSIARRPSIFVALWKFILILMRCGIISRWRKQRAAAAGISTKVKFKPFKPFRGLTRSIVRESNGLRRILISKRGTAKKFTQYYFSGGFMSIRVAGICGSLSEGSFNKGLLRSAVELVL